VNLSQWFIRFSEVARCITLFIVDVPRVEATKEQKQAIKASGVV
jgi:hypothetical protein